MIENVMIGQAQETASSVLEQYITLLTEESITFEFNEDGTVLMFLGDTEAGACEGYLLADELEPINEQATALTMAFIEMFYVLPIDDIPQNRRTALKELLLRLNESHRIGAYEYHVEDEEIRFRIYQTVVTSQPIPPEQLLMPLYEGVRAIDLHWNFFAMVLEHGLDAAHAVGEFYAHEALHDPEESGVNEELVARAGQLFEIARDRYREAGNIIQVESLNQRIRQLTLQAGAAMLRAMGHS